MRGLVAAGVGLVVLACGACDAEHGPRARGGRSEPVAGGVLRFSVKDAVDTLDPGYARDEVSLIALAPVLDTLVAYREGSVELEPGLATWEVSPDGRLYTFTLREGLRYGNGQPIVAQDIVRAIERVRHETRAYSEILVGLRWVVALDARRLVIELSAANRGFIYALALKFSAPQPLTDTRARAWPVASGPYEIVSWRRGERLELRRRANYHDPSRQWLDGMVMYENVPRDTQAMMFERGELDVAERLAAPDYLRIASDPAWAPQLRQQPMLSVFGWRMNTRVWPFSDRRVRQALNYALDKRYTAQLLSGTSTPAHGPLPPGIPGRNPALRPYPHDPARAIALLAAAGIAPGTLSLELVAVADEDNLRLAESLQSDLAAIGVAVRITPMAFASLGPGLMREGPGSFPFSYVGWQGETPDPTAFFDAAFSTPAIAAGNNYAFYASPAFDALLDRARGEPDAAARTRLYEQADALLHDDAPWIWNYHQQMTEVVQPYVQAYRLHPIWLREYSRVWLDPAGH